MLLLVLASATAASAVQPVDAAPRAGVAVQARASVRILSGERIRFDQSAERDGVGQFQRRDTVFVIEGKRAAASFIEFE